MSSRAFSASDRKLLQDYREFTLKIKGLLSEVGRTLNRNFRFISSSEVASGDGYFYISLLSGDIDISPGVKVGEEYIIKPVLWLSANAQGELESLGYYQDEEFPEYYIKELELSNSFFDKSFEEQLKEVEELYLSEIRRLKLLGVISEFSPTFMG